MRQQSFFLVLCHIQQLLPNYHQKLIFQKSVFSSRSLYLKLPFYLEFGNQIDPCLSNWDLFHPHIQKTFAPMTTYLWTSISVQVLRWALTPFPCRFTVCQDSQIGLDLNPDHFAYKNLIRSFWIDHQFLQFSEFCSPKYFSSDFPSSNFARICLKRSFFDALFDSHFCWFLIVFLYAGKSVLIIFSFIINE